MPAKNHRASGNAQFLVGDPQRVAGSRDETIAAATHRHPPEQFSPCSVVRELPTARPSIDWVGSLKPDLGSGFMRKFGLADGVGIVAVLVAHAWRSGVVAEEVVAQSTDEAHGDQLGHGMRVLPVNHPERAGRLERCRV